MVTLASSRILAPKVVAAVCAAPVAVLCACSPPNESASTATGTVPPIWTGSPAAPGSAAPGEPATLTTHLKSKDGVQVATATFKFDTDESGKPFVTVTVQTTGLGLLSPGFHGVHLHMIGKCEANSKAPDGHGEPGPFLSAGGHLEVGDHSAEPASGDLTSLQVRADGAGLLVTTTDAFTEEDLVGGDGTAIIIHGGADNFANIPKDRYTQVNGTPGPDHTTLATGDSGARVACGEIKAG